MYEDMQVNSQAPNPFTGLPETRRTNAAESEIMGAELEILTRPIQGLQLNLTVGYLDATFTKYTDAPDPDSPGAFIDHNPGPPVTAADQQILIAVGVPVAQARPGLVAECQYGRDRFRSSPALQSRRRRRLAEKLISGDFLKGSILNEQSPPPAAAISGNKAALRRVDVQQLLIAESWRIAAEVSSPGDPVEAGLQVALALQANRVRAAVLVHIQETRHTSRVQLDRLARFKRPAFGVRVGVIPAVDHKIDRPVAVQIDRAAGLPAADLSSGKRGERGKSRPVLLHGPGPFLDSGDQR